MSNIRLRQKGCFYGLAIGDALGAPIEFRRPGTFTAITGYQTGGAHSVNEGEWTDDTAMALALADSLSKGFNAYDQLEKYLAWYKNGKYSVNGTCFDIGNATRAALSRFSQHGTIKATTSINSSGNGSIMRLAPIPILYHSAADLAEKAISSSETTHGSSLCTSACALMATIIGGLIRGEKKETVLDPKWEKISKLNLDSEVQNIIDGSYKESVINGSGYVVESLEAAIWAFWSSDTFEDAVLKAVNLGNDADTTGAITGQFAGACYGYDNIPEKFIKGLARKDLINKYLEPIL